MTDHSTHSPERQLASQMIRARSQLGISQHQLAKRVGTGQAVISRLENMNANPSFPLLKRIAKALHTNLTITFKVNQKTKSSSLESSLARIKKLTKNANTKGINYRELAIADRKYEDEPISTT